MLRIFGKHQEIPNYARLYHWCGNIEPAEYDTSSCKDYKKLQELMCRTEERLRATMTDEQKELFEKYTDCVREYQAITDCLIFLSWGQNDGCDHARIIKA